MFSNQLKRQWGLHPMQEAYFNSLSDERKNLVPARVTNSSHDLYKVMLLGQNQELQAKLRGHLLQYNELEDRPIVGDWVAIELLPGDHQHLPIAALLPRYTALRRADAKRGQQTLVANIDFIGLVTSFNQDLNERRLERGIAMINDSGAQPLIVINKCDLVQNEVARKVVTQLAERFGDTKIYACSAQTGDGIQSILDNFSEGQSVAFLGMSGVGKSTLINAMIGSERMLTSEIRSDDSRGRHTTTHRELILTENGFWLIDNPGIREFSFSGDEKTLAQSFDDLAQLMSMCRFSDCRHDGEMGCQIQTALESGELATDRWQNYLKMKREIEFHANKRNKAYHSSKRKEHIKRTLSMRQQLKWRGRGG